MTVILTDKVDLDVIDMQERIRLAFPNILEIRRENQRKADYSRNIQEEELLDPYELCCSFLKEIDDEEKLILQYVLHTCLLYTSTALFYPLYWSPLLR